jgi:hypothetical protein
VNPEQIFNIVETRVVNESGQPTDTRRITPADWSTHYKAAISEKKEVPIEPGGAIPEINFKTPNKLRQMLVFIKRDVLSKIADTQYLLITLLEAPVLALALASLIRYFDESAPNPSYNLFNNENLPVYIFMSVIIAIFMGLTVSAEEIIKDRKILKREAFLNLSWNSYLMSKVFVQLGISAIQAFTFVILGNTIMGIRGMWVEYWIVLFTCWAGANMLGLLISDSFKAVVTIYILIPFLVIPQIILSGIMVKFEKLNPSIPFTNPVSVPFYGEFITARWGYEALAVKQFKDNRYESQFYEFDKLRSMAKFKRNLWYDEIKKNLNLIANDLEKGTRSEEFNNYVKLVYKELKKEQPIQQSLKTGFKFQNVEHFTPEKISPEVVNNALREIEIVRRIYIDIYNKNDGLREALLEKLQSEDREGFFKLQHRYANESLKEFVTNKNESTTFVVFDNEIFQKMEPIYMDPVNPFIKAHFYSPVKNIFGRPVSTFVVNVVILWIMTILLYVALYFRLLKKFLDSGEVAMGRKMKGAE